MELAGLNCKINPILSKDYPTLAKRPMYSVLDKTKIKEDFKISSRLERIFRNVLII